MPPAPGEDEGDGGREEEQRVGRLQREGDAGERPGEDRLPLRPGLERADGERGRDENRHDGREVRLLGQPERLGENLVDPAVVIAVDEERDRDERRRDEHGSAPEAGEAPREPRADVVHGERRDRAEHADLQDGRQGEELDRARAGDPRQRREQHRPPVARECGADQSVPEEPAARDEPDLVAALVRQPAVVVDREEERDGRDDLDRDDHAEGERDVPRQRVRDAPEGQEHGVWPGGGRRVGHGTALVGP